MAFIHYHFYGDLVAAKRYISEARNMAERLAMDNRTTLSGDTKSFDDGSVISVSRVNDQYSAVIYGGTKQHDTRPKTIEIEEIAVDITAGVVTDPTLRTTQTVGASEFSPSRQYRGDRLKVDIRRAEPILHTPPSASWATTDEFAKTYSQAGYITPGMFSGKMCELVQLALGVSGVAYGDGVSIALPGVSFASFFGVTHGLVKDRATGDWLVASVSPAGISLSPIAYLDDYTKGKYTPPPTSFRGYPLGILLPPSHTLATAAQMEAIYKDAIPAIDTSIGWCFDDAGSECRLVTARYELDGTLKSRVVRIKFVIDSTAKVYTVSVIQSSRQVLADPSPWWHSFKGGKLTSPTTTVVHGGSTQKYGGVSEYYVCLHEPLRVLFEWADATLVDKPANYIEGIHSSWFNLYPPITFWARGKDITGARAFVKYPTLTVGKDVVVDAPVHVTFRDGSFVTYNYFWTLDVPDEPFAFNDSQGIYGDAASDGVYGLTWYSKQLCYGTPPTIYSNKRDTRVRKTFLTTAVDPYWALLNSAEGDERLFTTPSATGFELYSLRTKTEWAFHSGLILPYMNREAIIETTFDCPGAFRAVDPITNKSVGCDFAVALPPTWNEVHKVTVLADRGGLLYSYAVDGTIPDANAEWEIALPDEFPYDAQLDISKPFSLWDSIKRVVIWRGAKVNAKYDNYINKVKLWERSHLLDAPAHVRVKEAPALWKPYKFIFDTYDYTSYAVDYRSTPGCTSTTRNAAFPTLGTRLIGRKGPWIPGVGVVVDASIPMCGLYLPTIEKGHKTLFRGDYPIIADSSLFDALYERLGEDSMVNLFTYLSDIDYRSLANTDWWVSRDEDKIYASFPSRIGKYAYRSDQYLGVYRSIWEDKSYAKLYSRRIWGGEYIIPSLNRGTLISELCPEFIKGAGAGVSYVGDISLFVRGATKIYAHGAIPNGLTLNADDVICIVGDLKNG